MGTLKYLFFIYAFFGITLNAVEYHTYAQALKLQKINHKIIMLDIVKENCHYCEDMNKNVLSDVNMSKWMESRFITVKIDFHKDEVPLNLSVDFTPTFYFINKDGQVVKKIPGSWSIEDFKDLTKGIQ